MKKIILLALVLALVSFGMIVTGLTDDERKMAADHLTQTQERLISTLDGLN